MKYKVTCKGGIEKQLAFCRYYGIKAFYLAECVNGKTTTITFKNDCGFRTTGNSIMLLLSNESVKRVEVIK